MYLLRLALLQPHWFGQWDHLVCRGGLDSLAETPFKVQAVSSRPVVQDVVGKHIVKVEPLNAILDPHYFVRALHECVVAWLRSHSEPSGRLEDVCFRSGCLKPAWRL